MFSYLVFCQRFCTHPALHSFPTRRSSDLRSRNMDKDQSYVLAVMGPEAVGRSLFPLGEYATKDEVDRKSTRLNSSHVAISYAVFCLKIKGDLEDEEEQI